SCCEHSNVDMGELGNEVSTALTSHDANLPSPFEVLAQDNLNDSVDPAIKYIVKVLAQNSPHRFGWCYVWFDELFAAVKLLIQQHFLSNYNSTFAEYYYELQRKVVGKSNANIFRFGTKISFKTLAVLVLLPYIMTKFKSLYLSVKEEADVSTVKSLSKLKRAIYYAYPLVHMSWHTSVLYYNFMFAIGKTQFHSPFYKLLNTKLFVKSPLDSLYNENIIYLFSATGITKLCTQLMTGGVHVGVFALQFVDWWYNSEGNEDLKQMLSNPIPKPPENTLKETKIPVPSGKICPLCNKSRRNETVLQTSGYAFCYTCVYKFVNKHGACPVTGYTTNICHLIRIYYSATH
uniref:Peroxisome assembly protein 12 n=2 Tax=Ciona intestinalis TaxID=7719 RepID=H2XYD5_CIOIN